jgi:hypothetical protein
MVIHLLPTVSEIQFIKDGQVVGKISRVLSSIIARGDFGAKTVKIQYTDGKTETVSR